MPINDIFSYGGEGNRGHGVGTSGSAASEGGKGSGGSGGHGGETCRGSAAELYERRIRMLEDAQTAFYKDFAKMSADMASIKPANTTCRQWC